MLNIETNAIITFLLSVLNVYDCMTRVSFSSGGESGPGLCSMMILVNILKQK